MAPKKKINGFVLFMTDTKKTLWKRGIQMSMGDMPNYCEKYWNEMSAERKNKYKMRAKKLTKNNTDKYTCIGEKVEDVKRQIQENILQTNAMYQYIEGLVRMKPAKFYLPKHKFILIHINPYTSENEGFYFPAEISMAEFSLERGLIRIFHQLVGFDSIKTKAPEATAADINIHSKYNHKIGPYVKLSCNYKEILLKMIGFIIDMVIDEDVLSDPNIDIPPIYTAHTSNGKELMITNLSLFYLYKSVTQDANRNNVERLLSVYHLDKLFMEIKNVSYEIKNPKKIEKALPSVAMATDSLTKDMISTIVEIGCSYHEELNYAHVCSNYYVCKWIYTLSTHCCQYFNIKLISGCHYDFDLSIIETRIQENINDLNTSKPDCIFKNSPEKEMQDSTTESFLSLEDRPTSIQRPIWKISEHKVNTFKEIMSTQGNDFPALGNVQEVTPKSSPVVGKNSWRSNANSSLGNTQYVTPKSSPIVGMSSWRSKTNPLFGDFHKVNLESSHVVGTDSWRSNANPPFDDSQRVAPKSSFTGRVDSWRSNTNPLFGNFQKVIPKSSLTAEEDNWRSKANRGEGIVGQSQDNVDQLNKSKIESLKEKGIYMN